MALGVEIKTFTDRDGVKHSVQGGGNVVEVYTDTESKFRSSGIIDTILAAGIHQVLYKREGTNAETNHFLLVRYITITHPVTHITRYAVEQCIIDDSGMCKRTRAYNDAEHTDPHSDWSDWEEIIPSVTNVITEDSYDAITSGAVFALRAEGYSYVDNKLSEKMGNEYITFPLEKSQDNFIIASSTTVKNAIENFISSHTPGKLVPCQIAIATGGAPNVAAAVCHYTYVSQSDTINFYLETLSGYRLYANIQTEQGTMEPQDYPDYFDVTDTNSYFS